MATENMYFPLEPGNTWTYRMANGASFTNTVDRQEPDGSFRLRSTALESEVTMMYDGVDYTTDSFGPGTMLVILRDGVATGDGWDVHFSSNGMQNVLSMAVRATDNTMEVEGHSYEHVMLLEGESKLIVDGAEMRIDFFTQYYYAKGLGLILTTSSRGDYMPLVGFAIPGASKALPESEPLLKT